MERTEKLLGAMSRTLRGILLLKNLQPVDLVDSVRRELFPGGGAREREVILRVVRAYSLDPFKADLLVQDCFAGLALGRKDRSRPWLFEIHARFSRSPSGAR
jgi:hypothetical protein